MFKRARQGAGDRASDLGDHRNARHQPRKSMNVFTLPKRTLITVKVVYFVTIIKIKFILKKKEIAMTVGGFSSGSVVKNLPAKQETQV